MTNITEITDTTNMTRQRSGLISTIFCCYRENIALFLRIMMPIIILGFLFNIDENFSVFNPVGVASL